jgi:hypothetical protein
MTHHSPVSAADNFMMPTFLEFCEEDGAKELTFLHECNKSEVIVA